MRTTFYQLPVNKLHFRRGVLLISYVKAPYDKTWRKHKRVSRDLDSDPMMTVKPVSNIHFLKILQDSLYVGSTKDWVKQQRPDLDSSLLGTCWMCNKYLLNEFSDLEMEVISLSWYLIFPATHAETRLLESLGFLNSIMPKSLFLLWES